MVAQEENIVADLNLRETEDMLHNFRLDLEDSNRRVERLEDEYSVLKDEYKELMRKYIDARATVKSYLRG